ncbi:MAG: hypothetical protein QOI80_3314 [Solirubrobacteraceae bacterium]|nr:hypothetical protein [Solirubrobacteraceae bacterium]
MSAVRTRWFEVALAAILLLALILRVWGIKTGLPYVYNVDEGAHFVPRAIGMFDHGYDPHYFINPPAMTYLFHVMFWLRWGGDRTRELIAADPTAVFEFARLAVAVLATASVGALAWVGVRLFDRRVALVAAALLAVAFLPVHYGHFALNDAVLVLPICLSLVGAAGILQRGRLVDYALAGVGLGLAIAVKYTGGMTLMPILAAAALGPGERRERFSGLVLAGALTIAAFLVLNPFALLSFSDFRHGLGEQSSASSGGGASKLGLPATNALRYYAGTLLWGIGVVPVLAAVAGGLVLWLRDYRTAMLLLPAPLLFLVFIGNQDRFFARWALPVYPFVILLAAWGAVRAVEWAATRVRRGPAWSPVAVAALVLGLQGLVYVTHNDVVLARADTREDAREWMVDHIPAGARIVVEPIAPDNWGDRWIKRPASHYRISRKGNKHLIRSGFKLEDYEKTLRPDLIASYLRAGDCWVVTGSILYGRARVTPRHARYALKYYRALREIGDVVYTVSPFARGAEEPAFSFDDSYNWRPFSYHRPGPRIVIYRIHGGLCT